LEISFLDRTADGFWLFFIAYSPKIHRKQRLCIFFEMIYFPLMLQYHALARYTSE